MPSHIGTILTAHKRGVQRPAYRDSCIGNITEPRWRLFLHKNLLLRVKRLYSSCGTCYSNVGLQSLSEVRIIMKTSFEFQSKNKWLRNKRKSRELTPPPVSNMNLIIGAGLCMKNADEENRSHLTLHYFAFRVVKGSKLTYFRGSLSYYLHRPYSRQRKIAFRLS
jgi:hypothetical protein